MIATLDDADDAVFFGLLLNADGTYCFEFLREQIIIEASADLTSLPAGNEPGTVVANMLDAEGNVVATAGFSSVNGSINSSTPGTGVANNWMSQGQTMKIVLSEAFTDMAFTAESFENIVTPGNSPDKVETFHWVAYAADGTTVVA